MHSCNSSQVISNFKMNELKITIGTERGFLKNLFLDILSLDIVEKRNVLNQENWKTHCIIYDKVSFKIFQLHH